MKFLYPEFIYLMLIPAVLLFYLISTNRDRLERLFLPEVLDRLRIEGDSLGRGGHNILAFAAFLFMTLALAQPVVEKGEMVVKSEGADLVIALDLSRSMNATDFYPDRVAFAKQKLQELIPELPVGRIGIVGFTSASFIVAPLTEDRDTLLFLLKRLKPEYISRDGTDIVAALKGALKLLEKSSSKKVLLVTDGGDRKDMREIEGLLKKSGIELSVLMVATKRGAPIPAGDGKVLLNSKKEVVVSRANTALHRPVSDSGGVYAEATISDSDERKIVEHFRRSGSGQVHERVVHQRLQLFYYPLAIALMILPFAFYSFGAKGGIKGFLPLAALLFLSSEDLKAGVMDFKYIKEAQEAYRSGDYDRSVELFERVARSSPGSEVWFDLASSYYKSGRYLEALNAFKRVVTKKRELEMAKLYGMANCYVKMGDLQKGMELYKKVLQIGKDEDAEANLKLVLKLMKELRKRKGEGKEQKSKDSDNMRKAEGSASKASIQKGSKPGAKKASSKQRELTPAEERKWMQLIQKQPLESKLYPLTRPEEGRDVKPW